MIVTHGQRETPLLSCSTHQWPTGKVDVGLEVEVSSMYMVKSWKSMKKWHLGDSELHLKWLLGPCAIWILILMQLINAQLKPPGEDGQAPWNTKAAALTGGSKAFLVDSIAFQTQKGCAEALFGVECLFQVSSPTNLAASWGMQGVWPFQLGMRKFGDQNNLKGSNLKLEPQQNGELANYSKHLGNCIYIMLCKYNLFHNDTAS